MNNTQTKYFIDSMSESDFIILKTILFEKVDIIINKERNLFNFEYLDDLSNYIKNHIDTKNHTLLGDYTNMYEIIDSFDLRLNDIVKECLNNIEEMI